MSRRYDHRGTVVVHQGRSAYRPFGPRAMTAEEQAEAFEALGRSDELLLQQRLTMRAAERRAMGGVCSGCGGKMPNRHQAACPDYWPTGKPRRGGHWVFGG